MRFSVLSTIRALGGTSGRRFADLLGAQLDATLDGVGLVERAVRGDIGWDGARSEMVGLEHRGDAARRELVVELSVSIITPLDREDLFRVSRSIDDVLDNLRDFIRECDLFGVKRGAVTLPLVRSIVEAVVALRGAVSVLAVAPREIGAQALIAHKAANQVRRSYDAALAELFEGDLDMEVLKLREVLRRLDVVGLRVAEAADALSDAAVKRAAGAGNASRVEND